LFVYVGQKRGENDNTEKRFLSYLPWNKSFFFFYKNHLLWFRFIEKDISFCCKEMISVLYFDRSPTILKELFNKYRNEYLKSIENKTFIFENRDGKWKKIKMKNIRSISTVIINEGEKIELLEDIENFFAL